MSDWDGVFCDDPAEHYDIDYDDDRDLPDKADLAEFHGRVAPPVTPACGQWQSTGHLHTAECLALEYQRIRDADADRERREAS